MELELSEKLRALADARERAASMKVMLQEAEATMRAALEAEWAVVIEAIGATGAQVAMLERELRETALIMYNANMTDKQVAPGLGIRETTVYSYAADSALEWAKEHRLCLALDKKAFEGLCKTASRPGFVEVKETPTATIATDLRKLYPAA